MAKNIKPLKITNMQFTSNETATLYILAGATLLNQGVTHQEAQKLIPTLTPANVLRLALGSEFPIRTRGGKRSGAGAPVGNENGRKKK